MLPAPLDCGSRLHRRTLLASGAAAVAGSWLTPLAERLALAAEKAPRGATAKSVIVLWMAGGPSQLDTFDPHPESSIGGGVRDIPTSAPSIRIARGFERLAEKFDRVSLVRSVVTKEGDHERATYNVKTGFRPDPTLIHPAIGAAICHQLSDSVEIPRHISILPGPWPARGGYLGDQYDAFKIGDPVQPIPDVRKRVSEDRFARRLDDLQQIVEKEFARGRLQDLDSGKTLHASSVEAARKMMASEQLAAFDVSQAPATQRQRYGGSPFGRGCLAALRLIEAGVRCVEVTLNGWDTHVNNGELQAARAAELDPAFASLIEDLAERGLLEATVILCGGEFGRTPRINGAGGRDHWPHGFSVALAGGGIAGGQAIGETAPEPKLDAKNPEQDVADPHDIADIHATIHAALGIDFSQELETPIGRPMAICKGKPIRELLSG